MSSAIHGRDFIKRLKDEVLKFLEGEDVTVVLFGSRARMDFSITSDVDIGIIPGKNFNSKRLALLREYIEDLNIPYKVEVVDLSTVSEKFRREALKEANTWKD